MVRVDVLSPRGVGCCILWRFGVKCVRLLVVLLSMTGSVIARAETGDERFRNLLMISGYSTVIGAAFGAALLAFTAEPGDNLDYVARGAAIGFLGGIAVGSFMVFSPLFIEEPWSRNLSPMQQLDLVSDPSLVDARLTLSPVFSRRGVTALAARVSLWRF